MMELNGQRVLVAGATGMVGIGVISELLKQFPQTQIIASYNMQVPLLDDPRITYVQADLRNSDDCQRIAQGCDCAIMAAATTANAAVFAGNPGGLINDNLIMNSLMLEAFVLAKIKKVIYIGSSTLYQDMDHAITEEELDLRTDPPPSYYGFGWTVRFIEKLCRFWHENSDTDILVVRASNIFGPYTKFSLQTSNFIPAIIRKASSRMDPFEIWGSPDVVRDVLYVQDFSEAIVALMIHPSQKFDVFNVSSGIPATVGEVIQAVLFASGHTPAKIEYLLDKPTTCPYRVFDSSKLSKMTGWKPKVSLTAGIAHTINWWEANQSWWTK